MRIIKLCVVGLMTTSLATLAAALDLPPPIWSTQPDVNGFEKIENSRLDAAQRSIDKIVAAKGPRTIDNTLRNYDDAVWQINAALYFSSLMEAVHPDAAFRDRATAMTRKASAVQTALALNRGVYQALAAIPLTQAEPATQYYMRRQLLEFRLAGVDKDDATRARLKTLNDELTEEQSAFDRNINDGEKSVEVREASELAGLPQDYIDNHKADKDGVIHITTSYPDYVPAMNFAVSGALRRRLFIAFNTRAYPQNRDVLMKMLRTRYDIASMLGYQSWADYNAADKMIGSGAKIGEFIQVVDSAVRPGAEREFQMLLAEKKKTDPKATTIGWEERSYYQEQVRRSSFNFDSQSVRPYFPYERVRQGILDTAATLFHVTFRQEKGVPAWDPSVETWQVLDTGKVIGRFYLDMHPRAGQILARGDGARARRRTRQTTAGGRPALQFSAADRPGSRPHGIWRRAGVFPRVRASHAHDFGGPAAVGGNQRDFHGVRFRRSALANAGGMDPKSAGFGFVCARLSFRCTHTG